MNKDTLEDNSFQYNEKKICLMFGCLQFLAAQEVTLSPSPSICPFVRPLFFLSHLDKFQWCLKEVSTWFQGEFQSVSRKFQES